MKVLRAAVAAKDARTPGYLAAVEAAATGGDDTHYDVPRDAYLKIVREHGGHIRRPARRPRIAVGDTVERMLTSLGITKELVQRLTRTKDCGCKARQRWLNQWGYKQQERIEKAVKTAAEWYGIT
jgi:hypothetical protein